MNAKDIKTQLIRLKPTYISPNPESCAFHGIFPPEIIPYDKKFKYSLCHNYIYLNGLISETCFAQQREPT